jgi:hypothetical protein
MTTQTPSGKTTIPTGYSVHVQVFNRIGDPAHETIDIPSPILAYNTMPTHSTFIGDINRSVREHLEYCVDNHTIAQFDMDCLNPANLRYKIADPAKADSYHYFTLTEVIFQYVMDQLSPNAEKWDCQII